MKHLHVITYLTQKESCIKYRDRERERETERMKEIKYNQYRECEKKRDRNR